MGFLWALLSFFVVAFGQPSAESWLAPIAAFCGYALFWKSIKKYPFAKERFWRALLWFTLVTMVQLSWMSSIEFQGVYILAVWVGISLILGVQFALLSLLIPASRFLSWPRILAMASLWTLLEWSRFHFLCGYSWNLSGLALTESSALQFASIFGVLGLSFWVILTNLAGLRAFASKSVPQYAIWLGVALLPYLFGSVQKNYHLAKMGEEEKELSCLLVQTGLLPPEKTFLSGRFQAFVSPYDQWGRILTFLSESGAKRPQLIVLPEAVVPFENERPVYDVERVAKTFERVFGKECQEYFPKSSEAMVSNAFWTQTIANLFDAEVVAGLTHADEEGRAYNSAFHAQPGGKLQARYDKRVLMPLAEYLPFALLAPLVESYGIKGFYTHGKEATVFEGACPFSISICYEETFPSKVREGRKNGAKLLVNVTNDGWYPFSTLPSQHFHHARIRSVENGAPLIRACNTGVTAAVDSLGQIIGKLDECGADKKIQAGTVFAGLNSYEYSTPYLFWGNWGILSVSLFCIALFFLLKRQMKW